MHILIIQQLRKRNIHWIYKKHQLCICQQYMLNAGLTINTYVSVKELHFK